MSQEFNPYSAWLGLSPDQRKPNYYELLGLKPLEADEGKIEAAVIERMKKIRPYQMLQDSAAEAIRISNELGEAQAVLCDPETKRAYDKELSGMETQLADAHHGDTVETYLIAPPPQQTRPAVQPTNKKQEETVPVEVVRPSVPPPQRRPPRKPKVTQSKSSDPSQDIDPYILMDLPKSTEYVSPPPLRASTVAPAAPAVEEEEGGLNKVLLLAGGALAMLMIGGLVLAFSSGDEPPRVVAKQEPTKNLPKKSITTPKQPDPITPVVSPPPSVPTPPPTPAPPVVPPPVTPPPPTTTSATWKGKLSKIRGRGSEIHVLLSVDTNTTVEAVTRLPEWEDKLNLFLTEDDYRYYASSVILSGEEGGTVDTSFRLNPSSTLVQLTDVQIDPSVRRSTLSTVRNRLDALQNDPLVRAQRYLPAIGSEFSFQARYSGWTNGATQVFAPSNTSHRISIAWPSSINSTLFSDYRYNATVEVVAEVLASTSTEDLALRAKSIQLLNNPTSQVTPSGRKYPLWNELSNRWNSIYSSPSSYVNQEIKIFGQFSDYSKSSNLGTLTVTNLYPGQNYSSYSSHSRLQVRFVPADEIDAYLSRLTSGTSMILDLKILGGNTSAPLVELISLGPALDLDQKYKPGTIDATRPLPGTLVRTLAYDTTTKGNSYFLVSWAPKGRFIAGATEAEVMVWNDATGMLVGNTAANAGKALVWHPNGSGFATNSSSSTTPTLWNPARMSTPQNLTMPVSNSGFGFAGGFSIYASYNCVDLSFNSNGTVLADSRSYPIFLWDTRNLTTNSGLYDASMGNQVCGKMNPQSGKTTEYAGLYSNIGVVVIDFSNRTVPIRRVISYNNWQPVGNVAMLIGRQAILQTPSNLQQSSYMDLSWNPQRDELALLTARTVEIWSLKTRENKMERILQVADANASVSFRTVTVSPDGKLVAAFSSYGAVYVWDIATGKELVVISNNRAVRFTSCSFSPDSKQLAVTQTDGVGIYQVIMDSDDNKTN